MGLDDSTKTLRNYMDTLQTFILIKWYTKSIVIDNSKQFCFDDAELVTSNVVINQNEIKVIIKQNNSTE